MKHKFKVGDKVRFSNSGCASIHTIVYCATSNDSIRSPMYLVEAENRTHNCVYEQWLELANMAYKFKVGDILTAMNLYNASGPLKVVYQGKMGVLNTELPAYLLEMENGHNIFLTERNLKLVGT
jgi:hypothetical protein